MKKYLTMAALAVITMGKAEIKKKPIDFSDNIRYNVLNISQNNMKNLMKTASVRANIAKFVNLDTASYSAESAEKFAEATKELAKLTAAERNALSLNVELGNGDPRLRAFEKLITNEDKVKDSSNSLAQNRLIYDKAKRSTENLAADLIFLESKMNELNNNKMETIREILEKSGKIDAGDNQSFEKYKTDNPGKVKKIEEDLINGKKYKKEFLGNNVNGYLETQKELLHSKTLKNVMEKINNLFNVKGAVSELNINDGERKSDFLKKFGEVELALFESEGIISISEILNYEIFIDLEKGKKKIENVKSALKIIEELEEKGDTLSYKENEEGQTAISYLSAARSLGVGKINYLVLPSKRELILKKITKTKEVILSLNKKLESLKKEKPGSSEIIKIKEVIEKENAKLENYNKNFVNANFENKAKPPLLEYKLNKFVEIMGRISLDENRENFSKITTLLENNGYPEKFNINNLSEEVSLGVKNKGLLSKIFGSSDNISIGDLIDKISAFKAKIEGLEDSKTAKKVSEANIESAESNIRRFKTLKRIRSFADKWNNLSKKDKNKSYSRYSSVLSSIIGEIKDDEISTLEKDMKDLGVSFWKGIYTAGVESRAIQSNDGKAPFAGLINVHKDGKLDFEGDLD